LNTGSSTDPEDFAIDSPGNVAYVADDSKAGGVQHWQYSNGTWMYVYTLSSGVSGVGARSLTVNFNGAQPVIYAITAETVSNRLVAITDGGPDSPALTLATSPANEIFRAVKFSPALTIAPAPALSAPALSAGNFSFHLTGVAGFSYVVQSSADLLNWVSVETNSAPFTFTVPNAASAPTRFFRTVNQP
jgi:hypothetical protein